MARGQVSDSRPAPAAPALLSSKRRWEAAEARGRVSSARKVGVSRRDEGRWVDKARPSSPARVLGFRPSPRLRGSPSARPVWRAQGGPRWRRLRPVPHLQARPCPAHPLPEARGEAGRPRGGDTRAEVRRRTGPRPTALGGAGGPRSVVLRGARPRREAGLRSTTLSRGEWEGP